MKKTETRNGPFRKRIKNKSFLKVGPQLLLLSFIRILKSADDPTGVMFCNAESAVSTASLKAPSKASNGVPEPNPGSILPI